MSLTSVDTDYEKLTITLIADFDAGIEQVWELWSDPRKLERWWGPPAYPATFEKLELTPGGQATYFMTGPDGAMWGAWRITAVDPPTSLQFTNAFADPHGTPVADSPAFRVKVRLTERDAGTQMQMLLSFESLPDMQTMVDMGTVEGLQEAVSQIDGLLA